MRVLHAIVLVSCLSGLSGCFLTDKCIGIDHPCTEPDPCGERRVRVGGAALVPTADGSVYALMSELSRTSEDLLRRFDANGRLLWTMPLGYGDDTRLFAAGDTLFVIDSGRTVRVIRDGAIVQTAAVPLECRTSSATLEGGALRVVGTNAQLAGCVYLVDSRGVTSDARLLHGHPDQLGGIALSTGDYVFRATDALLGYDKTGYLRWKLDVSRPEAVIESGGGLFMFAQLDRQGQLWRVALDGSRHTVLASWERSGERPPNDDFTQRGFLPVGNGAALALERGLSMDHLLLRADESAVKWQRPIGATPLYEIRDLSLGGDRLVLRGDTVVAFDLDGNQRWSHGAALAATAALDGSARIVESQSVDECVARPRLTSVDAEGLPRWTWMP